MKHIPLMLIAFIVSVQCCLGVTYYSRSGKTAVKPIDPRSIDLTQPTLFLVPYSHLDDIWRWSYPVTIRDFLKNTLDENFVSFEQYPYFSFNWTGASRYAMMKEYYPERYEELKKWVAAGRWHPAGSSWVENDTVVPSTESLIRQLLMGRTYFQDEFGKESRWNAPQKLVQSL